MAHAEKIWIGSGAMRRIFGVEPNVLVKRGVETRNTEGRVEHELADFYQKCDDLLFKRLGAKFVTSSGDGEFDMKSEKLAEEVRKLKLANDLTDGSLVVREEVERAYSRGMKAVADVLDGTVSQVKMRLPDVQQAVLAVIDDVMIEVRRKAARIVIKGE